MAEKKVTQDYIDGALQVFKILEIYKGSMTAAEIATERNHIVAMEVSAPTQNEITKADIASKAAQLREFNKELKASDELIKNITAGIDNLPAAFVHLAENLSALKK
jgi:hypothetical protein